MKPTVVTVTTLQLALLLQLVGSDNNSSCTEQSNVYCTNGPSSKTLADIWDGQDASLMVDYQHVVSFHDNGPTRPLHAHEFPDETSDGVSQTILLPC